MKRALPLFALLLFTTACSVDTEQREANTNPNNLPLAVEVPLFNNAFHPPQIEVAPGATVTFRNKDLITYSLTCDGHFNVEQFKPKTTYSYTFRNTGNYLVYDALQTPTARLTVIVR